MQKFLDFRDELKSLLGKRVCLYYYLDADNVRTFQTFGRIKAIDEETKSIDFEPDTQMTTIPVIISHGNLGGGGIFIYWIDEISEDADITEKKEPEIAGLRTEYIPYDKDGKPEREPQPGYVLLHKDHAYAKGTVYTKIKEEEKKEGEE